MGGRFHQFGFFKLVVQVGFHQRFHVFQSAFLKVTKLLHKMLKARLTGLF